MLSKKLILPLFLIFIITIVSVPMAFATDINGSTVTTDTSNNVNADLSTNILTTDTNSTPPEIPNGTTPNGTAPGNGTPPEIPNGTMPNGTAPGNGTPPEIPNGTMPNGTAPGNGTPLDMPNGTNPNTQVNTTSLTGNNFTENYGAGENFTVTLKDINGTAIIGQHISLNLTRVRSGASKVYDRTTDTEGNAQLPINLAVGSYTITASFAGDDNYSSSSAHTKITVTSNSTTNTTNSTNVTSGRLVVNGTSTRANNGAYSTSTSNLNTVLVTNGGKLILTNSNITKTGDVSSSSSESSDFYGTNAAVLVQAKSTLNITNCNIKTNATGANAIFVTNTVSTASGATAYVTNVTINTYKDKSRGLDATYGGTIIANNVTINTRGGSCAALATDRGEGTVTATNCVLNTGVGQTAGSGSPCIYSTGTITATNCTGTAYVAQIGCIEGKNSITLNNCNLTCYAKGNRQNTSGYVDLGAFFIYQSMSGDAATGTATLNATNSILSIASDSTYYTTSPMFHITNTAAIINLNNCTLNFGSGILIQDAGQNEWGTSGSNGGTLTFTATNQTLTGNIIVDSISTLTYKLTSSTYTGAINPSSSYGTTSVTINSGSTWTLTGNSHITSLTNAGTINYGTYTLYVNGVAYTASNPYKA
jgi:hypothetical protein